MIVDVGLLVRSGSSFFGLRSRPLLLGSYDGLDTRAMRGRIARRTCGAIARFLDKLMTKADIAQIIYARVGGFSKREAVDVVNLVFETMKETLGRGQKIKVSGFGNFVLRDKRTRKGRNPRTGEPIAITERRVLGFKPSQLLKLVLNGGAVVPTEPSESDVQSAPEVVLNASDVPSAPSEPSEPSEPSAPAVAADNLGASSVDSASS